jgi:RNA polymerase sigma-70 factor (ECF subfamily)
VKSAKRKTPAPGAFVTTRWSLILSRAHPATGDQEIREALAELCRIYWRPVFLFTVRRGYSAHDAEDLTQDFFARILKGDWLQKADPARGRFRSLLLKSLQNFLNDALDKSKSRKRGGDISFVSWDAWTAETSAHLSLTEEALTFWPPEQIFDASWAATTVQRALRCLCEECERKGRRSVFEVLSPYLSVDRDDLSYTVLAGKLNVPEHLVKKLLYAMRQRYRVLLREEVRQTVADAADVDGELRHLCASLAASSASATLDSLGR